MSAEMSAEHAPQCGVGAVGRDVCECVLLSRAIRDSCAVCVCCVELRGAWSVVLVGRDRDAGVRGEREKQ